MTTTTTTNATATTCMLCTQASLRDLPMNDRDMLTRLARSIVEGMRATAESDMLKAVKPIRPGTCVVERCAQTIEAPCRACGNPACQRCTIARELRAAEDRINADRDAELAELGFGDALDEIFAKVVEGLCPAHRPIGALLVEEWYGGPFAAPSEIGKACS